jgi:hypothetical protein
MRKLGEQLVLYSLTTKIDYDGYGFICKDCGDYCDHYDFNKYYSIQDYINTIGDKLLDVFNNHKDFMCNYYNVVYEGEGEFMFYSEDEEPIDNSDEEELVNNSDEEEPIDNSDDVELVNSDFYEELVNNSDEEDDELDIHDHIYMNKYIIMKYIMDHVFNTFYIAFAMKYTYQNKIERMILNKFNEINKTLEENNNQTLEEENVITDLYI